MEQIDWEQTQTELVRCLISMWLKTYFGDHGNIFFFLLALAQNILFLIKTYQKQTNKHTQTKLDQYCTNLKYNILFRLFWEKTNISGRKANLF